MKVRPRSGSVTWSHEGVRYENGVAISSARVKCRRLALDKTIEFRLHGGALGDIDHSLTPFLPLMSISAWRTNRVNVATSPVDVQALAGAETAARLLSGGPRTIRGRQRVPASISESDRGTAIWFSRGVDSLSALYGNFDEIDYLLGLEFIDAPYAGERQRSIWQETVQAAAATGKPLLHLSTNARDLVDSLAGWDYTHSAVFSSLGLFLSPLISRSWLAGGHRESTSLFQPSNRNDVQKSWSSGLVDVGQPPGETRRTAKAQMISTREVAQRYLRVCWESDEALNCGRCLKCLMTMTNFILTESLPLVSSRFATPFSLDNVRRLRLETVGTGSILLLDDLIAEINDDELRDAWVTARSTSPLNSEAIRTIDYL